LQFSIKPVSNSFQLDIDKGIRCGEPEFGTGRQATRRFTGSWPPPRTRAGFRSPEKKSLDLLWSSPAPFLSPTGKSRCRPNAKGGEGGGKREEELAGLGFAPPPLPLPRCRSRCWWSVPRASYSSVPTGLSTSRSATSSTTTPRKPPLLPRRLIGVLLRCLAWAAVIMGPSDCGIFVLVSGGSDIVLVIVSILLSPLSLMACCECCCAIFTSSIFSHTSTFN
jgi:hypothetical protein